MVLSGCVGRYVLVDDDDPDPFDAGAFFAAGRLAGAFFAAVFEAGFIVDVWASRAWSSSPVVKAGTVRALAAEAEAGAAEVSTC